MIAKDSNPSLGWHHFGCPRGVARRTNEPTVKDIPPRLRAWHCWCYVRVFAEVSLNWKIRHSNRVCIPCVYLAALNLFGRVVMFSYSSPRWSGFVGYSGSLIHAPSTMVARIIAVLEKYFLLIAFALLTGVITSRITSTTLQSKVLYGQFSDFPAAWVACVPSPAYIDTYDYIGRLQVHNILIASDKIIASGTQLQCLLTLINVVEMLKKILKSWSPMMFNFLVCFIIHPKPEMGMHTAGGKKCFSHPCMHRRTHQKITLSVAAWRTSRAGRPTW